jgi:hypothetical protein
LEKGTLKPDIHISDIIHPTEAQQTQNTAEV